MRCYQCKHWSMVSNNGLLLTGSCSQAPVIQLPNGENKVLKVFHAEAECSYPDYFEKIDEINLQLRQTQINKQKSPCWHLLSEDVRLSSFQHKQVLTNT